MTREEMTNLGAGRDLDGLVIGFLKFEIHSVDSMGYWVYVDPKENPSLFKPSENIRDAWVVLNKLIDKGAEVNIGFCEQWDCSIDYPIDCNWRETGETAPLAICRAALLAVLEATP